MFLTTKGQILFSSDYDLRGSYLSEYELEQIKSLADYGKLASIELSSIDKEERIIYAVQMTDGDYFISTTPKDLLYQSGKAISLITALIVIIFAYILGECEVTAAVFMTFELIEVELMMRDDEAHQIGPDEIKKIAFKFV